MWYFFIKISIRFVSYTWYKRSHLVREIVYKNFYLVHEISLIQKISFDLWGCLWKYLFGSWAMPVVKISFGLWYCPLKSSFILEYSKYKISSLFVRRIVDIICEKLTYLMKNLKKKLWVRRVSQVSQNLYKSMVQYSCPLSLFISCFCLFSLCSNLFYTLILFYLFILLFSLYKIVLNNLL